MNFSRIFWPDNTFWERTSLFHYFQDGKEKSKIQHPLKNISYVTNVTMSHTSWIISDTTRNISTKEFFTLALNASMSHPGQTTWSYIRSPNIKEFDTLVVSVTILLLVPHILNDTYKISTKEFDILVIYVTMKELKKEVWNVMWRGITSLKGIVKWEIFLKRSVYLDEQEKKIWLGTFFRIGKWHRGLVNYIVD